MPYPGEKVRLVVQVQDQELVWILLHPGCNLLQGGLEGALLDDWDRTQRGVASDGLCIPVNWVAQELGNHVDCIDQNIKGSVIAPAVCNP